MNVDDRTKQLQKNEIKQDFIQIIFSSTDKPYFKKLINSF